MNHRDEEQSESRPEQAAPWPVRSTEPIVLNSQALFRGRKEIQIRHGGELYRLLITKNGKLILNK